MTGYKVVSSLGREISTFATKMKAEKLIEDHPLLDLKIQEIEISIWEWVGYKLILF